MQSCVSFCTLNLFEIKLNTVNKCFTLNIKFENDFLSFAAFSLLLAYGLLL